MASLSSQLSPRATGTEEGQRGGMLDGRLPAPAGDIRPGWASWTMAGVPPAWDILAHCFQFSKWGEDRESGWQTTSPAIDRT
jgi:hypothetical protein